MSRHYVAALAKGITIVCVLRLLQKTSSERCIRKYQVEGALEYFTNGHHAVCKPFHPYIVMAA